MDELTKIQIEMASLGWDVETKIDGDGWRNKRGFMIWFKRSDWHGKFTYTITGREVVFLSTAPDANDFEEVVKAAKRAAERAKKAWNDFPNSIPCQNARGEVIEDTMHFPFEEGKNIKNVPKENKERLDVLQ